MYATTIIRAPRRQQPIVLADAVERQDPFQSCVCISLAQSSLNADMHAARSVELGTLPYTADYDLVDIESELSRSLKRDY